MAYNEPMPTPDGNQISTMSDWEAYWVGGLGGAAGVIAGDGGELAPSINSGARTVSTATGSALVRGFYVANPTAVYTATVPTPDAADRVDRLVLRLDRTASVAANWLKPVIAQGTSGSTTPPALQTSTTTGSWDLSICRWTTKADGSLSGLVDERYRIGSQFRTFPSTARPAASPPGLGRESDTGRLLVADGSAWSAVIDDTGWGNVTLDETAYWTQGDFTLAIRRVGRVVHLRGSVERHGNKLQETDSYSHVLTIPSGYRPHASHVYTAWSSRSLCRIRVYPSGDLAVTGHQLYGVVVGDNVYLDTVWTVD